MTSYAQVTIVGMQQEKYCVVCLSKQKKYVVFVGMISIWVFYMVYFVKRESKND